MPTARKRSSEGGTLTRANNSEPVCGLPTTTARFSDNPEMWGTDGPGRRPGGEHRVDLVPEQRREFGAVLVVEFGPANQCDALGGQSWADLVAPALGLPAHEVMGVHQHRVVDLAWSRPLAARTAIPAAMRRLRPATRTMKNSSRLEAKIARNLARSSSGRSSFSESSSTRWLNASQLSSRSMNRCSGNSGGSPTPSGVWAAVVLMSPACQKPHGVPNRASSPHTAHRSPSAHKPSRVKPHG